MTASVYKEIVRSVYKDLNIEHTLAVFPVLNSPASIGWVQSYEIVK